MLSTARQLPGADGRVRTGGDPPVPPELALKFLKEGNQRFVDGKPQSSKVDSIMRKELLVLFHFWSVCRLTLVVFFELVLLDTVPGMGKSSH